LALFLPSYVILVLYSFEWGFDDAPIPTQAMGLSPDPTVTAAPAVTIQPSQSVPTLSDSNGDVSVTSTAQPVQQNISNESVVPVKTNQ